jgi:hypothetical protein
MIMRAMQTAMIALCASAGASWAEPARFDSPEAAVAALVSALEAGDKAAVLRIFGPETEDILSTGNPEEDRAVWSGFLDQVKTFSDIEVYDEEGFATLFAGREMWPFPADIVRENGMWSFDAEGARRCSCAASGGTSSRSSGSCGARPRCSAATARPIRTATA